MKPTLWVNGVSAVKCSKEITRDAWPARCTSNPDDGGTGSTKATGSNPCAFMTA